MLSKDWQGDTKEDRTSEEKPSDRIQQNLNASGLVLAEFLRDAWIPVGLLQVMGGPNDNLIDHTAAQWLNTKTLSHTRFALFLSSFAMRFNVALNPLGTEKQV